MIVSSFFEYVKFSPWYQIERIDFIILKIFFSDCLWVLTNEIGGLSIVLFDVCRLLLIKRTYFKDMF